jgi:hypothetical protein
VRYRISTRRLAVTVLEAWHPHGRFHSSRVRRSLRIAAATSATLDVPARSDVRAGETVENCFLILRVAAAGSRWRVLARATVRGLLEGVPHPHVESVDVHRADG